MKVDKIVVIVLILTFTAIVATVSVFYILDDIEAGFDLGGGTRIIFRAPQSAADNDIYAIISIIARRLKGFGMVEPVISYEGDKLLVAELPKSSFSFDTLDIISRGARVIFGIFDEKGDIVPIIDSSHITGAEYKQYPDGSSDEQTGHYVNIIFDAYGGKAFADATNDLVMTYPNLTIQDAERDGDLRRNIAVLLDGAIISCPYVNAPINSGTAIISGFTREQAERLELIINSGAFPVELTLEDMFETGPGLGSDNVARGASAGLIGLTLISLSFLGLYRVSGLIAVFAMTLSAALLLAVLVKLQLTLTISSIIGIALSIGLCVDSQIAINESVSNELAAGYSVNVAVKNGFAQAGSTIVSAVAPLALLAVVLAISLDGSIRSFSLAFCAGVTSNLLVTFIYSRFLLMGIAETGIMYKSSISGWRTSVR